MSKKNKYKMKKESNFSLLGILSVLVVLFIFSFFFLVPINIHSEEFWIMLFVAGIVYSVINLIENSITSVTKPKDFRAENKFFKPFVFPVAIILVFIILQVSGAKIFHAKAYSSLLKVEDVEFAEDLSESKSTSSIALMDTDSAQMLGDREIGALSNVVSQFDVSGNYTQIDYQGTPIKVSALYYTGFFKWINNKDNGIPGYVTVNPVGMTADYKELSKGMKYVPSAYLLEDASRHIYFNYPTTMWGNLHFEIDEDGNPFYVASVYSKTISLFSGQTISGCIVMDPVTGETSKYDLKDVPKWVDMVYDGETICQQYNWFGKLSNGFWNSIISKKGCKKVTSHSTYDEDAEETIEVSDYGYVSKDGDIWIYTGVTSVNSDSSNIGFLLANERTGESHYFSVNGADEKSAMAAAEGEVQEKRYSASFPSLINVEGNPTYIMVLKDASGLVKLYATVNVEQYNLVTTASSQAECLKKYKQLLGIDISEENKENSDNKDDSNLQETEIVVSDIKFADIDGNTYVYLITDKNELFKAMVKEHEDALLIKENDKLQISYTDNVIKDYKLVSKDE